MGLNSLQKCVKSQNSVLKHYKKLTGNNQNTKFGMKVSEAVDNRMKK